MNFFSACLVLKNPGNKTPHDYVVKRHLKDKFLDYGRRSRESVLERGSEVTCHVVNLQQSYEDILDTWAREKDILRTVNHFEHPLVDKLGNKADLTDMKYLFMAPEHDAILKAAEVCKRTGKGLPSWKIGDTISYVWCKPKEHINGVDVVPVLCGFEDGYEFDVEVTVALQCCAVMNR